MNLSLHHQIAEVLIYYYCYCHHYYYITLSSTGKCMGNLEAHMQALPHQRVMDNQMGDGVRGGQPATMSL